MAEMMWAGRSSQGVDSRVNAFNSSIAFDGRMYKQDIQGSIAHATMLGEQGIISMSDSLELIGGLKFETEGPHNFYDKLNSVSDWPEKLAAKFRMDFGDSL